MDFPVEQQIVISGVGGQGVLFITRLLAEAAIRKGLPVLTSETHGMAQRGGTVVSHLKVGAFSSPMIRRGRADGLLALKAENVAQFQSYLKPGGWVVVNGEGDVNAPEDMLTLAVDAAGLARQVGNPRAVNLVLLGFALSQLKGSSPRSPRFFCSLDDIRAQLTEASARRPALQAASLRALEKGYDTV